MKSRLISDCSAITKVDIENGENVFKTEFCDVTAVIPCSYAILEPQGDTEPIASYEEKTVGIRTADKRFSWFSFSLTTGFGNAANTELLSGLLKELKIHPEVLVSNSKVVPMVRYSQKRGWLVFLLNLDREESATTLSLSKEWEITHIHDLLADKELELSNDTVNLLLPAWEVSVIHCS